MVNKPALNIETSRDILKHELVDVETLHANANAISTFHIPDLKDRKSLVKGDFARVMLDGERFWVKVRTIFSHEIFEFVSLGQFYYNGELTEGLVTKPHKKGTVCWFEPRHIIGIEKGQEDLGIGLPVTDRG